MGSLGFVSLPLLMILSLVSSIFFLQAFYCFKKYGLKEEKKVVLLTQFKRVHAVLAIIGLLLVSISFATLIKMFLDADYSLLLVTKYVAPTQPWFYRLGAVWSSHEGSLILWIWCLVLVQMFYSLLAYRHSTYILFWQHTVAQATISLIIVTLCAYAIWWANPFQLSELKNAVSSLTPLLQDPLLVIHPPILYMGYALTVVPFALSLGFLLVNETMEQQQKEFIKILKNPLTLSFCVLTIGITLGSCWAYYELGWGGYWIWDPVENASLLPWLAILSCIHGRKFSVLQGHVVRVSLFPLSMLPLILTLLSGYLVRSGMLSSVHSFASDTKRGLGLLVLFSIWGVLSFLFFGARATDLSKKLQNEKNILSVFSCMNFTVVGFLLALFILLWGTLYPLVVQISFSTYFFVAPSFFNILLGILSCILLLFLPLAVDQPSKKIGWSFGIKNLKTVKQYTSFFLAVLILLVLLINQGFLIEVFGISFAVYALCYMFFYAFSAPVTVKRIGIAISHGAFAIMLLGVCWDALFKKEIDAVFEDKTYQIFEGYGFKFKGYKLEKGDNYKGITAVLELCDASSQRSITNLRPQWRFYPESNNQKTSKTSYSTVGLFSQVYTSLQRVEKEKVSIKLSYRPYINLIFLGAILMIIGVYLTCRKRKNHA